MGPGSVSAFTRVFDALWAGTTRQLHSILHRQLAAAIVERDHIAFNHAGPKADDRPVAPHLGADGLAREHRRGIAAADGLELAGLMIAKTFKDGVAGDAEARQPMQDRTPK